MSRKFLACFFIILFSKVLFGNPQDSVQQGFVAKTERFFKESAKRSVRDLEMDRAAIRQNLERTFHRGKEFKTRYGPLSG